MATTPGIADLRFDDLVLAVPALFEPGIGSLISFVSLPSLKSLASFFSNSPALIAATAPRNNCLDGVFAPVRRRAEKEDFKSTSVEDGSPGVTGVGVDGAGGGVVSVGAAE